MVEDGVFILRSPSTEIKPVEVVAEKQAVSDTLPNGSAVFLNRQTKISYAYNKKKKVHDVKLSGEAYFNVKHSDDAEFIIHAGDVYIRDIGTSFNVKAYPNKDVVEVLVEEGEIVFYTDENPGIHLKESGKAVYNRKTKQFTIDQPEPNITAYKTKFFVFSDVTLKEAIDELNSVYETQIEIAPALSRCPITVSFRNESVEEIAGVLAETLDLTVTKKPGKIILDGKGCE